MDGIIALVRPSLVILMALVALVVGDRAFAQAVTVTNLGCGGTQLSFPSVPTAVNYRVTLQEQLACNDCGFATTPVTRSRVFGTFATTTVTLPKTPAFFGRWSVQALAVGGSTLGTAATSASGVNHAAAGAPFVETAATSETVCVGSVRTLTASPFTTAGSTHQWYQNGSAIPGATSSTYTLTMTSGFPATSTFYCVVSNACGNSTSGTATVLKGAAAPAGLLGLTSYEERESTQIALAQYSLCEYIPTPLLRTGVCNAAFSTFNASSMASTISAPQNDVTRTRNVYTATVNFTVQGRIRFIYQGVGAGQCAYDPAGTITVQGPSPFSNSVNPGQTVSGSRVLNAGNYTLTLRVQNGDLGCGVNCTSCGPSCQANCVCLRGPKSLDFNATYIVLVPADLDGDGFVDNLDLAILLNAWGTPGGDVNNDGTTNGEDLVTLLSSWGSSSFK